MTQIVKRTSINASANSVWQVLADFGNVAKWAPTVVKSQSTTLINRGIGTRRTLTTSSGNVVEEVIVEWIEGHGFTFEIPKGIALTIKSLRETWSVDQTPGDSIVVVQMDYEMKDSPISPLVDFPFARRTLQKMLVMNLAGLKYHIETGEMVTHDTKELPVDKVV